jgi:succinoglycan biosynthesis transport protein ExoP
MKLGSFTSVLWERRWFVAGVLVLALLMSPFLIGMTKPTYTATSEVTTVGNPTNSVLSGTDLPDLILSAGVMDRVKSQLHLAGSIDDFRDATSVKASPRSNVVPVTYRSKNAARALAMANAIADATVVEYKDLATHQYDQVIDTLHGQLADRQAKIRDLDSRLQRAVQSNSFVGSPQALETISARLDDLESKRGETYATYVADQAAASVGNGASRDGLNSVIREQALASDPVYVALRAGQSKDVADYESQKAGYTDSFPGLAGLKEKVRLEGAAVDKTAATSAAQHVGASPTYAQVVLTQRASAAQVAGDSARLKAIETEIATTRSRLSDLPRDGVAANQLRLQRDSAATAFGQLELRLQTTLADQAQAASLGSLIVLDHATEASPKISRTLLSVMIAALVLAMAIGAAYAAEALDPRIRSTEDAETLYGTPHIGSV